MIDEIKENLLAGYIVGAHVAVLGFPEIKDLGFWLCAGFFVWFMFAVVGESSCYRWRVENDE